MFRRLLSRLEDAERRWRRGFGRDITDPRERRRSTWHYNWLDHAHLRRVWTNQVEIAPGVWRSNQPTFRRLRELRDRHGVHTILNLRGEDVFAHYLFLREECAALGLRLVDVKLNATTAPTRERLVELLEAFDRVERPFLMHCKSGADRTGLAAALWMMLKEGQSLEQARDQLHRRHWHYRNGPAGVIDEILDLYEARNTRAPVAIDTWIRTEYTKEAVKAAFEARRAAARGGRSRARTAPKA
ncbi:hypothetical protein OG2516_05128 [Oceanicola granulosus HTCC2516]|uniref:Tyrosine specific protein phosphatases domain-containing protein n=1 Tax=Oceanicola granulosus (strain ATCC BAA-861 / DSM 15982 / KCTC 12143 / HTCC2516) TaxID=314256 RepID=Q2CIX6_OCEGH|nr:tyrosine-protein phosphatase [Oceanicola granulosus]EAR52463.1 hypothetical protein OG2516_05128 [Oceanicola granulosus HTCC2516]